MFCREMDSDNISAPCFSLSGFVLLSAALNRRQASRQGISGKHLLGSFLRLSLAWRLSREMQLRDGISAQPIGGDLS